MPRLGRLASRALLAMAAAQSAAFAQEGSGQAHCPL